MNSILSRLICLNEGRNEWIIFFIHLFFSDRTGQSKTGRVTTLVHRERSPRSRMSKRHLAIKWKVKVYTTVRWQWRCAHDAFFRSLRCNISFYRPDARTRAVTRVCRSLAHQQIRHMRVKQILCKREWNRRRTEFIDAPVSSFASPGFLRFRFAVDWL